MELVLSAIAFGGIVGAANQYMCLLIVSGAAKIGWIELSPGTQFMESWWFIAIIVVFWVVTVAPAYFSLVTPGVANVANSIINFLSGFLVPVSSALISLGAVGVITNLNPEAEELLRTLGLFDLEAGISPSNLIIAGGGALVGSTLTGIKAITKPALSASMGTFGHISAPMIATFENVSSFVLMGLLFLLASIDPWLLVGLLVIVVALLIGLLFYALSRLQNLAVGIGQFLRLIQSQPKAGGAILLEFLVWGSGWLIWEHGRRGGLMLVFWLVYIALGTVFYGLSAFLPLLLFCLVPISVLLFVGIGLTSAKALMATFEIPDEPQQNRDSA